MTVSTTNPPPGATVILGETVTFGQNVGVIEYTPEPGVARPNHMLPIIDPITRIIIDRTTTGSGQAIHSHPVPDGAIMIYWGLSGPTRVRNGEYLPYPSHDGVPGHSQEEPVNQIPNGNKWLNIISRFAHDVMAFNPQSNHLRDSGTHTTGHLPPTDAAAMLKNKATYQLGRAVVGVAFHRVEKWMTFDPERLALYPTAVPDKENWLLWLEGAIPAAENEIPIPNMGDMMAMICGDEIKSVSGLCVGAWVYLLNERIDASSYDSNMNSGGEVRLPDPVWDLWRPDRYLHRVTGTRSERSDQWDEIMGWFRDAHDHYLTSVSPAIEH